MTIREHLEAIRDDLEGVLTNDPAARSYLNAVAALNLLDACDREVLPRGRDDDPGATRWYGACRFVPDPLPSGSSVPDAGGRS